MTSDTYCALAWQSLSIDSQGRSRICCNNDAHYRDEYRGVLVSECASAEEALDTEYHRDVRAAQQHNVRHSSCSKCWDIEDRGARSFRQIWNEILPEMVDTPSVRYIDVTLGNKCNLTCRMCNEWNSHLWQIDNRRMNRVTDSKNITNTRWFEKHAAKQLINDNMHTATHINFLGGEPLIVTEQLEMLRSCVDSGRAKEINLSYNTNLTTLLPGQLELWSCFKQVNLNVSLEGIGSHNDYIRQNSRWVDIERNINTASRCNNVRMSVHATFGILNALTVHELMHWTVAHSAFGGRMPWLNIVHWPYNQDPRHLPGAAKAIVHQRLCTVMQGLEADSSYNSWAGATAHLDLSADPALWDSFWVDAEQLDTYKHTDIKHSLPELASYRT